MKWAPIRERRWCKKWMGNQGAFWGLAISANRRFFVSRSRRSYSRTQASTCHYSDADEVAEIFLSQELIRHATVSKDMRRRSLWMWAWCRFPMRVNRRLESGWLDGVSGRQLLPCVSSDHLMERSHNHTGCIYHFSRAQWSFMSHWAVLTSHWGTCKVKVATTVH